MNDAIGKPAAPVQFIDRRRILHAVPDRPRPAPVKFIDRRPVRNAPKTRPVTRPTEQEGPATPIRFGSGRCQTCGIASDDVNPTALVKRAERALFLGETILSKALSDEDLRLALGALDRVRSALEQLLKVHGLLAPDGAVTVNVDARRLNAQLDALSLEELRALARGVPLPRSAIEGEAC